MQRDDYTVGDPWPRHLGDGALNAVPVLICPCGSHIDDATGGSCETCGRTFDDRGNRVISQADLNEFDTETGDLPPDGDPDSFGPPPLYRIAEPNPTTKRLPFVDGTLVVRYAPGSVHAGHGSTVQRVSTDAVFGRGRYLALPTLPGDPS